MEQRTPSEIIKALRVEDQFQTIEPRLKHGGSLQARRLSSGKAVWYWRASHDGKTFRERIGDVDLTAPPPKLEATKKGYGLAAAIEKCRTLAEQHRAHPGGLQGLRADKAEEEARKVRERQERAERTFQAMLDAYVEHLHKRGQRSAVDAANIFKNHVVDAFPQLAEKPAADITIDDIVDIQRRLIDKGKGRTANKARAYLRAAFQTAIDARVDAALPRTLVGFKIQANPAAATKRKADADKADKRPLSLREMRTYWRLIRDRQGLPGAALRLHLLSGGQRIEQLLRLKCAEIRDDAFVLYDIKGRPGKGARPHVLPITKPIRDEFKALPMTGTYALSTTNGEKPLSAGAFADYARDVRHILPEFQPKRLRSGIETLLAEHGISRDTRAAL